MPAYQLDQFLPDIDPSCWIAPCATIIGNVVLGYAQSGRAEVYQRQNKPVPEERSTGLRFDNLRRMVEQPSEAAAK